MVDGPSPSEAAHIYDRFFSELAEVTYSTEAVGAIQARRQHPDLEGRLYYDELLNLALMNKSDENEFIAVQQKDSSQYYPPKARSKESIIELIQLIQTSSFDRIKKMALWYYIMLDLDMTRGGEKALQFSKEIGLPRSARYAMTGYWFLDKGDYQTAVSYLTEQPDFVSRIISTISPLRYTSTSSEETRNRALALSNFLDLVDVHSFDFTPDESFEEARIVATCWSHGVRTAWSQSQRVIGLDWTEEGGTSRSKCVGRILEFCFMPEPKSDAIKALLALPLDEREEEMLCHNMVNSPSGIHFTSYAHAIALDVLLVRRINSGQYYDAILLDRRINTTVGLPHLSRDVTSDAERLQMRRLRSKRQDLVRSAYSVLTNVERQLLDLGKEEADADQEKEEKEMLGRSEREMSWENVGDSVLSEQSTPRKRASEVQKKPTTPLSASLALRRDKTNETTSESFLSAVISASPGRGQIDASFRSGTASPLSRSILQGSPMASRSASILHMHEKLTTPRRTPSRSIPVHKETASNVYSPLASARSYKLPQPSTQEGSAATQVPPTSHSSPVPTVVNSTVRDGPYSRLAQQLQEQMQEKDGDLSIDRILGRKPQSDNDDAGLSGTSKKSTLAFTRPVRRYKATYEIGQASGEGGDDEHGPSSARLEEEGDLDQDMEDATTRQRGQKSAKRGNSRTSRGRKGEADLAQERDDDSVPGSFPGRRSLAEKKREKDTEKVVATPAKRRSTRRATMSLTGDSANEEDDVPELIATPTLKKSRGGISRSNSQMASTPIRRSTRLSVEPESTPVLSQKETHQRGNSTIPLKEKRSKRSTSKGPPSVTSASEMEETENEKEASSSVSTRTRRKSRMPGTF
ncbi:hypothetical protein CBS101457_000903 [Exobasidium rhododendri]|nr:hypothetical protein CBS101457_000903 [Exobasidium rhododendri]